MKILIVKTSSLGDIIHVFPALHYLRKKFPQAQIDWVVEAPFCSLVESHPDVSCVIPIHTRTWKRSLSSRPTWKEMWAWRHKLRCETYDIVFDLQGNCKSALVLLATKGLVKAGFGLRGCAEWPNVLATTHRFNPPPGKNIREDYLYVVQRYFNEEQIISEEEVVLKISVVEQEKLKSLLLHSSSAYRVLVCPGAAWVNKQASFESLKMLLKALEKKYQAHFLFTWGTVEEEQLSRRLFSEVAHGQLIDKLPLPLLQNLMRQMHLVVAMDSLPLHLCATTATPTLSFFGPSSAFKYRPLGDRHQSFEGKCPYGMRFEKRCPRLRTCPTGKCIKEIFLKDAEIEIFADK